ncbi:MAG: FMN-binding glutamate synthase family protein [Bacteriovoracaceae bacterium]|nr:FMN-binding glutamate synthase family protein [Bacteriovoracaceae bacterium]
MDIGTRSVFVSSFIFFLALSVLFHFFFPWGNLMWAVIGPLFVVGFIDFFQTKQAIRRNFPVLGNFRYFLESIRPEINQYFIENNTDGKPFSREERSIVYQRAKRVLDTMPFGTQQDVYKTGYEYVAHSLSPLHVDENDLRVEVGGPDCKKPYSCSIFNISAMSYGSLSKNAVMSLNRGAAEGKFAHNTGEGGISKWHLKYGGDLIWQIGTGYFGCRNNEGGFDPEKFKERSQLDNVKMIEIKLSQGAKPGHGGILPAEKLTPEIAEIRGVPMGRDVNSPPGHSAFKTPTELCNFVGKLRELSGGKPVGFKLCIGNRYEFHAICKAMIETGIKPDFIVVDGAEGGTGAAPLEFTNWIGTPGIDALVLVNNILRGYDLRKDIKIITSGKVTTGFGALKRIALGADIIYAARSMMLALGCIQALRCNSNHCPAGVATQNPDLMEGLVVDDKYKRVLSFHDETVKAAAHMLGAMGLDNLEKLHPRHIKRRVSDHEIQEYSDFLEILKSGCFLKGEIPEEHKRDHDMANSSTFDANDVPYVSKST